MIPLLFCKEVGGYQAFVLFVFVLSFSLFQICLVSLDYPLLIAHVGILHWTSEFRLLQTLPLKLTLPHIPKKALPVTLVILLVNLTFWICRITKYIMANIVCLKEMIIGKHQA